MGRRRPRRKVLLLLLSMVFGCVSNYLFVGVYALSFSNAKAEAAVGKRESLGKQGIAAAATDKEQQQQQQLEQAREDASHLRKQMPNHAGSQVPASLDDGMVLAHGTSAGGEMEAAGQAQEGQEGGEERRQQEGGGKRNFVSYSQSDQMNVAFSREKDCELPNFGQVGYLSEVSPTSEILLKDPKDALKDGQEESDSAVKGREADVGAPEVQKITETVLEVLPESNANFALSREGELNRRERVEFLLCFGCFFFKCRCADNNVLI